MSCTLRPIRGAWLTGPLLAVGAVLAAGCGGSGVELGTRSLAQARQLWEQAGIRDYDLEWTSSGARSGHYRVAVRDGAVTSVRSVQPDGTEVAARPADPSYYGIDGLFRVLDEELDAALAERPFGRPPGTRVLQRFQPDPVYGFPRRYRRDVAGMPNGLAIDVIRFDPRPNTSPRTPQELPPLRPEPGQS
ncbi:MAG: hypothetical protein KatS3mg108_0473 [Isosphaeraceae bacterium]|jgi:hypothetical protein|nr:MAG: hypothetical protein KatS3mg108_0473 [Isosphaeraceae bacterium]